MERKKASDFPPGVLKLFDGYVHGAISRREFLDGAAKFAVVGFTQSVAKEVAGHGIRVNAVCPGFVLTSMQERELVWEGSLRGMTPEAVRAEMIAMTPLGRIEKPEDVADVVAFLAGDGARFMTGQSINVTGGVRMD